MSLRTKRAHQGVFSYRAAPTITTDPKTGLGLFCAVRGRIAYAEGRFVQEAVAVPVRIKRRREVDLDFTYLAQAAAQQGDVLRTPASRVV